MAKKIEIRQISDTYVMFLKYQKQKIGAILCIKL